MSDVGVVVFRPPSALLPLGDGRPVLARLLDQLAARGMRDVAVLESTGDPAAELAAVAAMAERADTPVLLCAGDLITHGSVLDAALAAGNLGALAVIGPALVGHAPAWRQRGRVLSAGSAYHQVGRPNGTFRGVLRVDRERLPELAEACRAMVPIASLGGADALDLILVGLVRTGVPVGAYPSRRLFCRRVSDPAGVAEAEALLAVADEDAIRLSMAVKKRDDLFATYLVSSYSPRLVRWAARLGLSPNGVTWLSTAAAVAAGGCFALGARPAAIAGALLLYLGFVLDCVDGQLARYLHRYSRFGGWLDVLTDRAKEYAVYAGLAVGAARGGDGVWVLAIAAIALQTVRHVMDCWYTAVQDERAARLARLPVAAVLDEPLAERDSSARARLSGALTTVSQRVNDRPGSFGYWLKRTIVLPIGERWALIGLAAAVWSPRIAFSALLGWATVAFLWTFAGRTARTLGLRTPVIRPGEAALHRDDGPLARLLGRIGPAPPLLSAGVGLLAAGLTLDLGPVWSLAALVAGLSARHRHDGALDWLVPAALRAMELLVIVALSVRAELAPWLVFTLLTAVVLYHYDLAARLDKRSSPLRLRWLAGGWDGRLALLAAASLVGRLPLVAALLAGYLGVLFLVDALGPGRRQPVGSVPRQRIPHRRSAAEHWRHTGHTAR